MKKLLFSILLTVFFSGLLSAQDNTRSDVEAFVTRFYENVLARQPDSTGLNNWVNGLISKNKSGADVAKAFVLSPEFKNENVDNYDYVAILYYSFFNREPDTAGLNNWLDKLYNGISREEILDGFLGSLEFSNLCQKYNITPSFDKIIDFVTRFYQNVLGRKPDTSGLNNWVKNLVNGTMSGSDLAKSFIFSQEFLSKNVDDYDYVNILYYSFFNRKPDSQGFDNWMDKLYYGTLREEVLDGFLSSLEFQNLCQKYNIKSNISTSNINNHSQDIVDIHNDIRAEVFYGYKLVWSNSIADSAQEYANYLASTGKFEHDNSRYGENLYASSTQVDYIDAIDNWYDEIYNYDYDSNSCIDGYICGHYTQMIWRDTTEIGCGKATYKHGNFKGGTIIVCRYNPAGNYVGERPY